MTGVQTCALPISVFYIFKKVRYMHSIFHLFVLAASCLQFFSVYFFVI